MRTEEYILNKDINIDVDKRKIPKFEDSEIKLIDEYIEFTRHIQDSLKHETDCIEKELPIFKETSKWLDIYFGGKVPNFVPRYKINNITPFRQEVINIMNKIPFGKTITYNDIAKKIAAKRGLKRMSAQAVGGAVGWNPICIIISCHRVVGSNGSLTGYGGGIQNKISLLTLEKNEMSKYRID